MTRSQQDPTASIEEKAAKRSTKNIPVVDLEGDMVKRFNEAKDQIAKAEKVIEAIGPQLTDAGLKAVFKHNIKNNGNSIAQISSVRLRDKSDVSLLAAQPNAKIESVLFTWTKKGKKCDHKQVTSYFERAETTEGKKAKWENYAAWFVVATFNTEVFIDPVKKLFCTERYQAFVSALEKVSKKFKVTNPLSVDKTLGAKPEFHMLRFVDFKLEQNMELTEILPTTTKLEPDRPESEEMDGE